ncbi:MAG: hypothetical protein LBD57_02705 [Endomicrobium sp.]|jgi:hypothetical protein|uniref:hypothetical protein n=1 Tax=Candidatus Endomicrobiellum cubanum TaxID=3242325 RepID=UPI0028186750|nr:hypothetical protein [Endomicrobium sp.]
MTLYTIYNSIIERAKVTNPIPFLEQNGFYVFKRSSENNAYIYLHGFTKIGDEDIRTSLKTDGHWISCYHDNTPIGSNINLVLELYPQMNCIEAAKQLCYAAGIDTAAYFSKKRLDINCVNNASSLDKSKMEWCPQSDKPSLVLPIETGINEGIAYLKGRGISESTIKYARNVNFLKFLIDGIIFCGYDHNNELRCATKRSTVDNVEPTENKRDLRGSIKAFAPVLPGSNEVVWIVEGGVDALALRDIALRQNNEPPTIIVTGGRNTKTWIDNPRLQKMIKTADRCYICLEGDPGEKFVKTYNAIIAQRALVLEKIGKKITIWPENGKWQKGCKDMADLNLMKLNNGRK